MTLREKTIINTLNKLAEGWPDNLWLFSNGTYIYLMRKNEDGEMATKPNYIIAEFSIANDGGDF